MTAQDWRLAPCAAAVWAGAWLGTSGVDLSGWVLPALAAGAALLWRWRRAWWAPAIAALLVTTALTGARSAALHGSTVAELAGRVAQLEVRLVGEPRSHPRVAVAEAVLLEASAGQERISGHLPVTLMATGDQAEALLQLTPGASYQLWAKISQPEPTESKAAVLGVRQIGERLREPAPLEAAVTALRQGLRDAMRHSPQDQAALVPSLVVGDTTAVSEAMRERFRVTGLAHLMAVSGANLVLFLGAWLALLRGIGVRGWWLRGAAVLGVAGFVAVCGPEPSVLRAAGMGLVALAGLGMGRSGRSLRGLFVAVSVLLWIDPWLGRSAGFALSVAACAGIVLLSPRLRDALSWLPRWLAEALAVPLAAQLSTQPIVTALSGQVSLVGVATNALAGPFVGPTTILGLLAAALCWWPAVSGVLGWLAGWIAQPILWLAAAGESVARPALDWPADAAGIGAVSALAVLLAAALPRVMASRLATALLAGALVLAVSLPPLVPGWPAAWLAVSCDVGQGDATLIRAGPRSAVLVDAGPEPKPVFDCLTQSGIDSVPLLVLTHYHADHTGGAEEVIERFRPMLILTRAGAAPTWLGEAAAAVGAELRPAEPGETLWVGDATWTTVSVGVAAEPDQEQESSAENDASVVAVASSGGLRLLLAGDAEPDGQRAALRSAARLGISLAVHVLKLPHHGSARQDAGFFAATGASVAVASCGEGNAFGHPAAAALDLARQQGMSLARTDTQGSLALSLVANGLEVVASRGG